MVKNLAASAGDTRGLGSIPGSRRSPGGGHGNSLFSSLLAWRTPWTEEPGSLQSMDRRVGHDRLSTNAELTLKNGK